MAVLLEGLQGSGKSYKAVYDMHYQGNKYSKIFTNIDGIKVTDKILSLEFKKFTHEILTDCYNSQVTLDGTFEESIEILQKFGILPYDVSEENRVLMVIDEAQNYFGKSVKLEASLVWFITQHRHLYIELYLITQKYTLLRPDYHLFNLVYKAYPPVKQFGSKKIRYAEYAGLPLNDDNLSKKFTLPKEQKIFDMYVSGDKVESPNILKKFFWVFLFLVALVIIGISYFFSIFGGGSEDTSKEITEIMNSPRVVNEVVSKNIDTSLKLYTFVIWDDGYFYIRDVNEEARYPIKFLKYIKDTYFDTVVDKFDLNYRTMIYVLCDKELTTFLKPIEEKKSNSFGSLEGLNSTLGTDI